MLNAGALERPPLPLVPLLLPFGAIDFDDRSKAQQAVEMAGCSVAYGNGAALCAGIGSNPLAGAFVYLVGQLQTSLLKTHHVGQLEIEQAHRVWVELHVGDAAWRWIAPFQLERAGTAHASQRGRLVAFPADEPITSASRPLRDFRGWLWQEGGCRDAAEDESLCARRTFVSIRLPVPPWSEGLGQGQPRWPPPELAATRVRLQLLGPGEGVIVFDSDEPGPSGAASPFSLAEFQSLLLPGEGLQVRRAGTSEIVLQLRGEDRALETPLPWIEALTRRLPVAGGDDAPPPSSRATIATRLGDFELTLAGDHRGVNRQLAAVATRVAWFVAAMLAAVLATWLLLEWAVIRRITLLTRRAAAVAEQMRAAGDEPQRHAPPQLELAPLAGQDELALLAHSLRGLLQRVNEDMQREQIRTRQERDQWHAVGHEIVSPLQSLLALHGQPGDPAARYLERMQQAVRVLYGQASPSEAFEARQLALQVLDLNAFCASIAANAPHAGIRDVRYEALAAAVPVHADEHSLEDVVTHVLRNAERHRHPGTPITLALRVDARAACLSVHNAGAPLDAALLPRIFDYGVSGVSGAPGGAEHALQRGQGLFVARTYMAKMGGTIAAHNADEGVTFELTLVRAQAPA
jgi:signal transduction histidine kinase